MEQVFFNVPLSKLEPIFKRWIKEAQSEIQSIQIKPDFQKEQPVNIQEAAVVLNLSVPTVYTKVSKGELPVMKRGKRLYFYRSELLEYLESGRRMTNAEIEKEATTYVKIKGGNNG